MPLSIWALTAAMAGAAVAIAAATRSPAIYGPRWIIAPLAATLVAAGALQVEFRWRGERYALDLLEAAIVPLLVVFAGPGAVAVTAVTKAMSQRLLGVAWFKTVFNSVQWATGVAIASVVYLHLRGDDRLNIVALAVAVALAVLNSHVAVAVAMALAQRGTFGDVVRAILPSLMPGSLAAMTLNTSTGLLFAAVTIQRPELTVLFLVPLGLCWWGQRAYTEVVVDRARVAALQSATHELGSSDIGDALPAALESIRIAFASAMVAVADADGSLRAMAGAAGDAGAVDVVAQLASAAPTGVARALATDDTAAGAVLRNHGHRNALTARLPDQDAVLVSIDRGGLDGFDAGELAVFQALAREIASAHARAELHAQLVRERAHLFEIVDRSSDGIFTVTAGGVIGDWNPAMTTITGFTAAEASSGAPAALLRPSAEGVALALERWKADGIESFPSEIDIITRSGEIRALQCSFSETASEPTSLVVTARDVTMQREVDRLRDDFVANVSHELRTPLTSIVGFTTMLLEPPRPMNDTQRAEAITMIRKGARRLERLVRNLLEVSRIEHREPVASSPVDIGEAIDVAMTELLDAHPDRTINVDAATGAVRALGNQLSVEQILTNLLANALKYSDDGPIDIVVDEHPDRLTVSIRDHGPGIPPGQHERVFERFHRVDHEHVQAGTGLGLYLSRQLASSMSGALVFTPTPGGGATFSLELPAEVHLAAVG